jgi:hypothetical protein
MAKNSSVNLSITPNATGYTIAGGTTTVRGLTVAGASDINLSQTSVTSTSYTLPSSSTSDILVAASTWNAAGVLLYGSASSASGASLPSVLSAGTSGQTLQSTGTAVQWVTLPASAAWQGVSTTTSCSQNNNYFVTSGTVAFTLPTTAAVGSLLSISVGKGTGFSLAQAALQSIQFGSTSTTVGVGGSLTSTAIGDTINMVCIVANTTWLVTSCVGNITIV